MRICRYGKDVNPNSCTGCEYGCLEKKPAAYINRDFEEAVKEMEYNGQCRGNKTDKSKRTTV